MVYLVLYLEEKMIKTILWDFDGVILNSMKIKGDGFIELFKECNARDLKELEKYHYAHGGVSRFEKIQYFYNEILKKDISQKKILKLAEQFANIIEKKIFDKKNLIQESLLFIQKNYQKYNFHIVSGAEEKELNHLCKEFEIDKYFLSIHGSPTKKSILIKNIVQKYDYNMGETIMIGDAITDYDAALKNHIQFYGYNNSALKKYGNYIESFEGYFFE